MDCVSSRLWMPYASCSRPHSPKIHTEPEKQNQNHLNAYIDQIRKSHPGISISSFRLYAIAVHLIVMSRVAFIFSFMPDALFVLHSDLVSQ